VAAYLSLKVSKVDAASILSTQKISHMASWTLFSLSSRSSDVFYRHLVLNVILVWLLIAKFYVSLTVHLGIIPVNNQLDALFEYIYFFNSLHVSSTQCSSSGETNCINTSSGMFQSMMVVTAWYTSKETGIPGSHLHRVKHTRWCINTICLFWWWALCARNM
jgi:hypothetical protein